MKTLLILRHAKSSWKDSSLPDHDRPLNKRGLGDAPGVGRFISKEGFLPDLVLCSTAVRARETVRLALENTDFHQRIEFREDLYAFDPGAYLNALVCLEDRYQKVMIVGHNPALEELLAGLTGDYRPMPTAALAVLDLLIDHWSEVSFGIGTRLQAFYLPKEAD